MYYQDNGEILTPGRTVKNKPGICVFLCMMECVMCEQKIPNISNAITVYTQDNDDLLKPGRTIKIKPNIRMSVMSVVCKVD